MNKTQNMKKGLTRVFEYIAYGCLTIGGIGFMGVAWGPGFSLLNESGQEFYRFLIIGSLSLIGIGINLDWELVYRWVGKWLQNSCFAVMMIFGIR